MSLFAAHKLMIATAILFCTGFAVREAVLAVSSGGAVPVLLGAVSAAGAVALAVYLRWLVRSKGQALDAASTSPRRPRDN
jgi:hypothetical protein